MKLSEKLGMAWHPPADPAASAGQVETDTWHRIKSLVHSRLVDMTDMSAIDEVSDATLAEWLRELITEVSDSEGVPLNTREQAGLTQDIINEIKGLGPIEPLIRDDTVQDILVNHYKEIFVERNGRLEAAPVRFRDNEHLMQIIDRIVAGVGRRIDESSPMVDARLADGSRVNAVIPPLAIDGPALSIRKFGVRPPGLEDLLASESVTPEIMDFLKAAIRSRLNILISGGTGSGKTTMLNILSGFISPSERTITIEDSAELQLRRHHVLRLESRPPNIEGKGEVTLRDLVRNSLRMRPDRIIVGEVRGAETLDMLQAMNTGHPGSMSTVHANSPRDALTRLEVMVGMGGFALSERAIRTLVANAVHLIVQLARLSDGRRRLVSVSELAGMQGDSASLQEIFLFEQTDMDREGRISGVFQSTGTPSRFQDHMRRHGAPVDPAVFDFRHEIG